MHFESDTSDRFFNRNSFCKNLDYKDSSLYLQSDELQKSGALRRKQLFHSSENGFQRIHQQNSSLDELDPPTPELRMVEQTKGQVDNLIIPTNLKNILSHESIEKNSQKYVLGILTKENQRQYEPSVSSYQDDDRSYVNSRKVDNQDTPISNSNNSNSFSSDSASQQQIQGEVLQDIRNAQLQKQLQIRQKKIIKEENMENPAYISKTRNFLVLFYYISRFLVKIKRVISHRKIEGLDDFLLKVLNDKAYSKSGMLAQRPTNLHKILQKTKIKVLFQLFKKVPVFEPNSLPSSIWDIVILLTVIFQVSALPIILCFDVKIKGQQQIWSVYQLPFCIFLIDILKNFNTGFYRQGHTVLQRVEIVRQYLRARFWWDLGINFALFLSNQTTMLNLFVLVRAYDLQRLLDRIDEDFLLMHRIPLAFQLIQLFMTIMLVAHLVGCGFHLVATLETGDSWVSIHQMQFDSLLEQYVTSLYWATITMITVGYGDIVPITFSERVYVLLITIVACGVFGYAFNSIGAIFQDRAKRNSEFKEQKYIILEYMRARSISQGVQTKIVKYLEFINAKNSMSHERGEQILELVSESFRRELQREYYGSILEKYRIFGTKLSKKCLGELALKMRESTYGPGEVVFQQGECDGRFFYVTVGEVEVYIDGRGKRRDDIILGKIESEKFFGQQGFFNLEGRKTSVRSTDISRLVSVHIDEFIQTIKQFPQDYMRDEMLVGGNRIDQFCYCCNKFSHTANMCPLLHYQIDHEALIKRHLFELPQRRKMFKRHQKIQQTAYSERKKVCTGLRAKRLELVGIEDIVDPEDFLIDRDFYLEVPSVNIQVNSLGEKEIEILIQEEEEEEDEEDEYNIDLINKMMENQKCSQKNSSKVSFESKRDPVTTKLKQAIIKLRSIKDPENNNEDLHINQSESDLQSELDISVKNSMDDIKSLDNIQNQREEQLEQQKSAEDIQALLLQKHSQSLQRQLNIQLYLETQTMDTGGVQYKWGNNQFNKKISYSLKQSYVRNLSQEQAGTTIQKQINDQSQTPQQAPARRSLNNDPNDFSLKLVGNIEQQKEVQDSQPVPREKFINIPQVQISTQKSFDTKQNISNSKLTQENQKLMHQQATSIPQAPKSPQLLRFKSNKGSQMIQDTTVPVTPRANNFKKLRDQQTRQSLMSYDTKVNQNIQLQELFLYDMDMGFNWSHYFMHNNKQTILEVFLQQQKTKFGEQLFVLDLPESFKKRRKQRASDRKASQRGSIKSIKRNNSLRSSVQHSPKSKEAQIIASNKRSSIQIMMQRSQQNASFDRSLEGFANHIGQMRQSNQVEMQAQQSPIKQELKDGIILKSSKK